MEKPKAVFNWSGGKDSALALYKVLKEGKYEVVALLTTVNRDKQRSTMHDIPLALLEKQAKSIGIPLHIVNLPPAGSSEDYKNKMLETVEAFKDKGVTHFIFGDIFLHDVRKYREEALNPGRHYSYRTIVGYDNSRSHGRVFDLRTQDNNRNNHGIRTWKRIHRAAHYKRTHIRVSATHRHMRGKWRIPYFLL